MKGILLTLVSLIFWGSAGLFAKLATNRVQPLVAGFLSLVAALPTMLVVAYLEGYPPQTILTLPAGVFLAFTASGLLTALCGRSFYFLSVARIGTSVSTAIGSSRVLIAPITAVFLFQETLRWNIILGSLLVFSGLYFLTRE